MLKTDSGSEISKFKYSTDLLDVGLIELPVELKMGPIEA